MSLVGLWPSGKDRIKPDWWSSTSADITLLYVCEIAHLILHPNRLYMFHVHPGCSGCEDYKIA